MWDDVDASFSMLWLASLQKLRVAWCAGAVPHELPAVLEGSMYGNPTPCSPLYVNNNNNNAALGSVVPKPHCGIVTASHAHCHMKEWSMQQTRCHTNGAYRHGYSVPVGLAVRFVRIRCRPQLSGSLQVHARLVPAVDFHILGHLGRLPPDRGWYEVNRCKPRNLVCAFTQDRTQLPSLHCCVH
jgi:hypothetical protein